MDQRKVIGELCEIHEEEQKLLRWNDAIIFDLKGKIIGKHIRDFFRPTLAILRIAMALSLRGAALNVRAISFLQ
jgi:hypothetical protein